jgi:hypothetical protein
MCHTLFLQKNKLPSQAIVLPGFYRNQQHGCSTLSVKTFLVIFYPVKRIRRMRRTQPFNEIAISL